MTRTAWLLALLSATTLACAAQTPVDGRLLGLSDAELQAAVPEAHRTRKPLPGPRGLRGLWDMAETPLAGLPFGTTFYFRGNRVQRIEQLWTSAPGQCAGQQAFSRITAAMDAQYGNGLASGEDGDAQLSSVWLAGDFDVVGYFTRAPAPCTIRLVYQWHLVKDASEL